MELRHIRYFLAIAEEGSFTRAAEKLGIGQPPLSQQIKALEREVGTQLFRRLPHGVALTEAGQAFHSKVAPLPLEAQDAIRLAQKAAAGESGVLRLGFTGTAAINPLVPASIRHFKQLYPTVEIQISEGNSATHEKALLDDRLDAAILRPSLSDLEALTEEALLEEPLLAALPANHPEARTPDAVDLWDLRREAFIVPPREVSLSLHDTIIQACMDRGFSPLLGSPAPQIASILSVVAAELGVALMPAAIAELRFPGVALRPLKHAHQKVVLALAYKRGTHSVLVRNFRQAARKTMNSQKL